jgi:hypothetical protein
MRRLWPYLVVLAVSLVWAWIFRNDAVSDAPLFYFYGEQLLSGRFFHAYSNALTQVGPLQLAGFGLISKLATLIGKDPFPTQAMILQPLAALAFTAAAGYVVRGYRTANALTAGAGVLAILTGLTFAASTRGHPAEPLVPAAWVVGGIAARKGKPWIGGLLIGIGAGFELWALLGLPLLLLTPDRRSALRPALFAIGFPALLLLPFAVGGDFHMLDLKWYVQADSPITLFVKVDSAFTWPWRLLQGAVALAAGVAVTRATRLGRYLPWFVAATVFSVRLLLDPYHHQYYFSGFLSLAILGGLFALTSPEVTDAWTQRRTQARPAPPPPL